MEDSINNINKKLIELLSKLSKIYFEKHRDGLNENDLFPLTDRDKAFDIIKSYNRGPLTNDQMKTIYSEILSALSATVMPVRVVFLGPDGTFSQIALHEIFGKSVEQIPQKTIFDVFHEVEVGNASYGVIPVENSSEGSVTYTLDEFMETDLNIIAEKYIRITYCLLSKNSRLDKIKRIYSHPQPLGQCKRWIRNNLSDVDVIHVDSTSRAAEIASEDRDSVAIASDIAADLYRLNILASRIEDSRQNYTRFFAIGKKINNPTGNDKTSIICVIKDKPGALLKLLKPFDKEGINMTKIESRPDKKKMWEYNFFIDFLGHKDDKIVKKALNMMRDETVFLKILGSYPVEV